MTVVEDQVEIPTGWKLRSVAEVADTSSRNRVTPVATDGAVPFISMALMPERGSATTTWEMRPTEAIRSGVQFREGDVLLAKITPCLENGKLGVARDIPGGWGFASTEVMPITPREVTPEFLALFLAQESVRSVLASKMQGATGRQRLPKEVIDSFPIIVPPLAEQKAIARAIEVVRKAMVACEIVIATTRQLQVSLLKHLLTFGPVPVEETSAVALWDTEIGPIPNDWELARLGELADVVSGGTPSKAKKEFWSGPIPWVSPKDLKHPRLYDAEDHISEGAVEAGSRLAPAKTVFLVVRGMILARDIPVAQGMVPMAFNQDLKGIVARKRVTPDYLLHALMLHRHQLAAEIGTSAHGTRRIGSSAVENILIPVPPPEVQSTIASILEMAESRLAGEQARGLALEHAYASLLRELATGTRRLPEFTNGS